MLCDDDTVATYPASASEAASWAPRTKFLRPLLGSDVVLDTALVNSARNALDTARLTVIAAQAGAGKTTLAAAVLDAAPDLPAAWISLDQGDDDLSSLLHLLAGALSATLPHVCPALTDLLRLRLPAAADPRRAVGVLVNDLLEAGSPDLVLVLDDVDALRDTDVAAALDYLVAYAPPGLRLLATARGVLPFALARLRALGHLHEIGGDDLHFGVRQTEELLNGRLGLQIPVDGVEEIAATAAGWVTGVRLLAQARARGEHATSESFVARKQDRAYAGVQDFLTEEILGHEPAGIRRFLLDTAVLEDVTQSSATAVARRPDAAAVLEALHRRHHFLIVRSGPASYRYHQLLKSALRHQLAADGDDLVAELHRRAAAAVDRPAARIEHLLAAGDPDAAALAVTQLARELFAHPAQVGPLNAWVERLPPDIRGRHPWLTVIQGLAAGQRGDLTPVVPALDAALDALTAAGDHLGRWLAARLLTFSSAGMHTRASAALASLETSPQFAAFPVAARVDHYINAAYGLLHSNRWPEAARRLNAALDLTMATGDDGAVEILAQHLSPLLTLADGALAQVEAYVDWTTRRFPSASPVIRLGIAHQRVQTHFLRGQLDAAAGAVAEARALHQRLGGLPFVRLTLDWVEATTLLIRGETGAARALLERRQTDPDALDLDRRFGASYLALLARILRLERHDGELALLAAEIDTRTASSIYPGTRDVVRLTVRAQAAWVAGDLASAAALLREALPAEDRLRLIPFAASPRLDLALVLLQQRRPDQALRELRAGLAAGRGLIGMVTQAGPEMIPLLELACERSVHASEAAAALAVLGQRPPPAAQTVPGSSEVLTSREVEVLRLLAAGASNRDLAATLLVSENTVKTHVARVLTKLGAHSRAQAAARARDLRLL